MSSIVSNLESVYGIFNRCCGSSPLDLGRTQNHWLIRFRHVKVALDFARLSSSIRRLHYLVLRRTEITELALNGLTTANNGYDIFQVSFRLGVFFDIRDGLLGEICQSQNIGLREVYILTFKAIFFTFHHPHIQ